jgi:VIT1/CCC1 family predicted Fe2+/Mn2+ transporter
MIRETAEGKIREQGGHMRKNVGRKKGRTIDEDLRLRILGFQRSEVTEYHIYSRLSGMIRDEENSRLLSRIADDERRHYEFWREYTNEDVKPDRGKVFRFVWIARIFGLTFGIKLMEKGEELAQVNYGEILDAIPEAKSVLTDEDTHEHELIGLLQEERLSYVGSIVLGLNDALVELTGALAGLTFALQNTRLIALAGLITGIAASFSMAASEYLSTKSEGKGEKAVKSSIYTGLAYIVTVMLLIAPYLIIPNYLACLGATIVIALLIILVFNFYVSVAKDYSFRKRFTEMAVLSLGVAALSFGIGYVVRITLGVDV